MLTQRSIPSGFQIHENLRFATLVVATAGTAYLCYKIISPFMAALIWAIALAIVSRPLHCWLARRLRNRTVCALAVVIIVAVALVLPVIIVTEQIVSEASDLVNRLRAPEERARLIAPLTSHPRFAPAVRWVQSRINVGEQAQTVVGSAGAAVPAAFIGSLAGLAQLAIALFTMFFLLRDAEFFMNALRSMVPLSSADTDQVLERVQQTVHASVRGRVVIAIIQGVLGGLMFWFLGLPGAVLWGAVMAMFAVVPMLGAFIVWLPASLFLLASGHPIKAAILVGWGAVVIGTADNFLYPLLVGKDLRLHTLAVFFSVLGGVAAFGAPGLVIGPVVFALADALIEIWGRRGRGGTSTSAQLPVTAA
jgi:predicted PurR-regulated permease PerM